MKENANPIIYQVSSTNEIESDSTIAARILKRLNNESGSGQQQQEGSSSYDSLYHLLEPHEFLSPMERSFKSALASIDESVRQCKDDKGGGPLDIFQVAGIKTFSSSPSVGQVGTTTPTPPSPTTTPIASSSGMYFFQPCDAAILSQQQEHQQQQQERRPERDTIDQREIFDMIRNIQDPEHPLTLEQLNVVNCSHISVTDNHVLSNDVDKGNNNDNDQDANQETMHSLVDVKFTPTIPHCSMATLIGLCIRVKLLRSLPKRFKVTVRINPGTHASEASINRQLNDKERVIAAMENTHLFSVVNKCIANGMATTPS